MQKEILLQVKQNGLIKEHHGNCGIQLGRNLVFPFTHLGMMTDNYLLPAWGPNVK